MLAQHYSSESLDSAILRKMDDGGIVGVGAAIILNKKVVWTKGYGFADKERGVPFSPSTIMNIGSISKTFTGVCLMQSVEQGKLDLDEDINKYLPFKIVNPYFPKSKITLRNIATHTSSLSDRYPFYTDSYHYEETDAPESLGDFLRNYFDVNGSSYSVDNFVKARPGSVRRYSNIAAALAGYIVELANNDDLKQYARKHIFQPLEMKNTSWSIEDIDLSNHTRLYDNTGETLKIIPFYSLPTYPDGGVRTSVADLAKFFITILNDGRYNEQIIMQPSTAQAMRQFQFTKSNKPKNINIKELNSGIFWASKRDVTYMGHAGSDPGVKTEMLADLNAEVGVILFTNTELTESSLIRYHFGIFDDLATYGKSLVKQ